MDIEERVIDFKRLMVKCIEGTFAEDEDVEYYQEKYGIDWDDDLESMYDKIFEGIV